MRIEILDNNSSNIQPNINDKCINSFDDVINYIHDYYSMLWNINNVSNRKVLPVIKYLGYQAQNNVPKRDYTYIIDIDFSRPHEYAQSLQTRTYDAFVTDNILQVLWKPARFNNDSNLIFQTRG